MVSMLNACESVQKLVVVVLSTPLLVNVRQVAVFVHRVEGSEDLLLAQHQEATERVEMFDGLRAIDHRHQVVPYFVADLELHEHWRVFELTSALLWLYSVTVAAQMAKVNLECY